MSRVDEAIEIIKYSQSTHIQWIDYIDWHNSNRCNDQCKFYDIIKTAGDREHHSSRVERYQLVLDVLESVR